jgi:hypothetical protein
MNNDLIILIIITGVTISAVIMFVLHANDEVYPGDTVLYASQLAYPTGKTENTFNSFLKNEFINGYAS